MQLGKENIAGILSEAIWISLSEAVRYIDPILAPVIEAGVKSLLELTSEHAKLPEDEIKGRIKKLRYKLKAKLKSLGIPKDMESQLFETLNFVLIRYGGEPLVRGVDRIPKAYANAVVEAAGGAVPADVRETVLRMLEIFYEEIFKDNTLGSLVSMEIVGDLAQKIDKRLLKVENQLRLLEPLLPERQAASLLKRPWEAKPPGELSFASLTAWAGIIPFKEVPAYTSLLQKLQDLGPGLNLNLIIGEGGSGKTRLGFELARTLKSQGWMTGALPSEFDAKQLSGLRRFLSIQERKPRGLFILIDYAAERSNLDKILIELSNLAEGTDFKGPIAVLMLERHADFLKSLMQTFTPTSDRNYQYTSGQGDWPKLPRKLREALHNLQQSVIKLKELDEKTAKAVFLEAHKALRVQYKEETKSALSAEEVWPELKEKGGYPNRPLALVLAAYLAVQGQHPANPNEEALLAEALMHEKEARWWPRLLYKLGKSKAEETQMDFPYFEVLVAGATLLGYLEREEALPFLKVHHIDRAFFTAASSLLPLKGSRIGPLEPDPVAGFFLRELWRGSEPASKKRLAELLAEVVRRNLEKPEALGPRLNRACQVLKRAQVGSERERMRELYDFWRGVFRISKASANELIELFKKGNIKPPNITHPLFVTPLAAAVLDVSLPSITNFEERARFWGILGNLLEALGLHEQALKATEESVKLYRKLAAMHSETHLSDLAANLNNLGSILFRLSRHDEAQKIMQEVVNIYRKLSTINSEIYLPYLAMSLNNLGTIFAILDRHKEALEATEEAVKIRRDLAARKPEINLPDLATSLHNLAVRYYTFGHHGVALQSIQNAMTIWRKLMAKNYKTYLPEFAASTFSLGSYLFDAKHFGIGVNMMVEALKIYRDLATTNPEFYLPDLAGNLTNLGIHYLYLKRYDKALYVVEEAIEIYRQLATKNSVTHLPDLSKSLLALSFILMAVNRQEEALKATEEAVQISREMVAYNPEAYLPDLAYSLFHLGMNLYYLDRHENALHAMMEAINFYRELVSKNPEVYGKDLAAGLTTLGDYLFNIGRDKDAFFAYREALIMSTNYFHSNPQIYGEWMNKLLSEYVTYILTEYYEPELEIICPLLSNAEALQPELARFLSELCQGWKSER